MMKVLIILATLFLNSNIECCVIKDLQNDFINDTQRGIYVTYSVENVTNVEILNKPHNYLKGFVNNNSLNLATAEDFPNYNNYESESTINSTIILTCDDNSTRLIVNMNYVVEVIKTHYVFPHFSKKLYEFYIAINVIPPGFLFTDLESIYVTDVDEQNIILKMDEMNENLFDVKIADVTDKRCSLELWNKKPINGPFNTSLIITLSNGNFSVDTKVNIKTISNQLVFTQTLYEVRILNGIFICLDGPVKLSQDLDSITFKIISDNAENYVLHSYKTTVWLDVLKTPSDKQYDLITIGAFDQKGFSIAETHLLVTEIVSDLDDDNMVKKDLEETGRNNNMYELFFIMVIFIGILILALQLYDILYKRSTNTFHYTMMNSK